MKKITNISSEKQLARLLSFSLLIALWMIGFSAQAQTTATFNSTGTFAVPAGITTVSVEAWGGGGAGGGNTTNADGGGGGGGGAYSKNTAVSVTGSSTFTVTVGPGATGTAGDGSGGGDSWFGSATNVMAKGGAGGISGTLVSGAAGGAGGTAASSVGITKFSGGNGGAGRSSNTGQGGPGGSSAGTAAAGVSGATTWSTVTSGTAPTGGGKGGNGGAALSSGLTGVAPGAGGGGSGDVNSGSVIGGNGAPGRVLVTYTCPTYALTAAPTATGPFCAASTSVVTLRSASMPSGTYTVTYNLTGGTTASGTASMTFTAGSPGTGTFTTSTLASSTTPTTISVTGLSSGTVGNGACVSTISTFNTVNVTAFAVTANAGSAFTKGCTLNASGAVIGEASAAGYTYSWSPATGLSASNVSNPTANPTTTTTYTVTKTYTATGCSATASVTVTVDNTPPTAVAGADFTKTCALNPTGKVIGETAVTGNTYSWSPATGLSSATVANPTANPTVTTTYTVTKTNTATGCTATASITATVDIATPTVSAGSAFTKTCVSNINGAPIGEANVAGFTYSWSPTAGLSASTISNPTANPTTTTTYTLTKTNTTNGCSATANVTVTVNNTLIVGAGADFTKTCAQNPSGLTIGEANVAGNTYTWSPAAGLSNANISNPVANPTVTTTYTVTKTNAANGCVATDDIIVTVNLTTPVASAGTDFTKTCVTNPSGAVIGEATQSGHTYSWSPTTGLSSSTIANPTANPTATTTYTVTKTNTASGCTGTDTVTVTVNTAAPTVAALTGTQTVCAGSTTLFASATGGGVWATSNSAIAIVSGGTVTGVSAGTATINYTVTGANGCTTTVSRTVTVNALPISVVASGAASICYGSNTGLTGSASIPYTLTNTIAQESFNGTPSFAAAGSGTIFAQKSSPSTVGLTTITNNFDSSKFMMASQSSAFSNASTVSTLTSASINTTGFVTPLNLTFNHSYQKGDSGTQSALVQVSTDGGSTWVSVKTYTANQGANNNFVAETVNLDGYLNNAALKVRFSTTISTFLGTGWWAIDNLALKGNVTVLPQYSWTADTASGVNGLPSGAATLSSGNASISVNPTATTNYTLVATDPITGCNSTSSSIQVFVKPLPTVSAPSNETHCNGDNAAAVSLSGTPGATYDISGGAAIGLANATGLTQIPAYTAATGSATISITPKLNGCTGATVTYNVTVNPTPTVTAPANQSYCNGAAVSAIALSGTPSGVTFDIAGGSVIGLSDVTGVTAIPAFTAALGSAVITLTPHANGCTGTAVTFNITVNPVLTPTFAPVSSICAGTTLSALPTTSLNGVTGSWSPSLDNMNTTTYTFTPNPGQCVSATLVTLTIVVNTNTTYYADTDSDGFGDAASTVTTCLGLPTGYVTNNTDCDDTNDQVYRTGTFYTDVDMDGYNNGMPAITICYGATVPSGLIAENNGTDCNDFDAEINIWHVEVLGNGIDDNCDGNIDEVGPVTVIIPSICGSTLSHIANLIYVSTYGQATGYRFQVTNGANVRLYDTNVNRMSLLSLPGGVTYGTTYTIRVSLQVNGFWQAYGAACNVTTPSNPATTNIIASMCGTTLASMGTTIYCNQVVAANHYRFELSDGVNAPVTVDSPLNRFNMAQLAGGPQYNTTYSVRVALRFGNIWEDYGNACSITTPATPGVTNLIASQCGITLSNTWTTLYAQQVADAQGYRFEVTNGATVRFYDTTVNRFALRNLTGSIAPNTAYTVRVAILFNGFYQTYGSACTITTVGAISRHAAAPVAIFDVKTFPNPYADNFRIDMNTSSEDVVEFKVYDMIGRQVEARKISVSELGESTLGAQYPSGVYNIIVAQGENVKTLRVIKR